MIKLKANKLFSKLSEHIISDRTLGNSLDENETLEAEMREMEDIFNEVIDNLDFEPTESEMYEIWHKLFD